MAYVAGIDIAGQSEEAEDAALRSLKPRQDSTVITIAEIEFPQGAVSTRRDRPSGLSPAADRSEDLSLFVPQQPTIRVVQHYWFTGKPHSILYPQMVDLLKNVWGCKKIAVDATGIGQPVASFLRQALGSRVEPFTFTQQSKSQLGFQLLAAVNSGRLKLYAPDSSPEYQELWLEVEKAKSHYRPNQTMSFYVDPAEGHDDFVTSMALVVRAAEMYRPRRATGSP